jgi:hypothetical protein
LLGERIPDIAEAFRVWPVGQVSTLRPIRLRGANRVDPRRVDLFRFATEERARLKGDRPDRWLRPQACPSGRSDTRSTTE